MAERDLAPGAPLLAVESATARLSVALRLPDGRVFEQSPGEAGHHAEAILPLIDSVLEEAGCGPDDPGVLAVSIGPGSFTSLRVGLATVKGLAFATRRPIVPVPTLEVLAWGARRSGEAGAIAALLDARRGDLYAAVFEPGAPDETKLRARVSDGLFRPEALAAVLPELCTVVGEGASLLAQAQGGGASPSWQVRDDDETRWPRARHLAELAWARVPVSGEAADDLAPRYVRRAEAEAKRTAQEVEPS